ncbi:MAG: hypothetical protein SVK54_03620 [candidate division WOR-3 bacterium]|nr:hypothetical protein [candidate division WOR-3 bacterium]
MLWNYISVTIKHMNVKGDIREMMHGKYRADEYELSDMVSTALSEYSIEPNDNYIDVYKRDESTAEVKFAYKDSIAIPIIMKYIVMEKKVDEVIKIR